MARDQRITIYDGALSTTPFVGTRPTGGTANVVITTAAGSDFPHLDNQPERPTWGIDIVQGSSSIGESTLVVQDKRRTPADQKTGWFTKLIKDAGGSLLGLRVVWEEWTGTEWRLVMNGTLTRCELADDLTSYAITLRDMRERARKLELFPHADTTTIFPRGAINGWGIPYPDAHPSLWVLPPTEPAVGVYRDVGGLALRLVGVPVDRYGYVTLAETVGPVQVAPGRYRVTPSMKALIQASNGDPASRWDVPNVEIWWRDAAALGAWHIIRRPRTWMEGGLLSTFEAKFKNVPKAMEDGEAALALFIWPADAEALPTDGQRIEVMLVMVGEPSESAPLHIEGEWGVVVKDILDGKYGARTINPDGSISYTSTGIPYDAAAIAAVKTPILARITEKVDLEDGRALLKFLEDFLFRPIMAAPGLNELGELTPIFGELPSKDLALPSVDDTLVVGSDAKWVQSDKSVINSVEWVYPRFYALPVYDAGGAADRVGVNPVTLKFNAKSEVATKPHKVDARMFGAATHDPGVTRPSLSIELGAQLANAYQAMAFDRFFQGGEPLFARIRESAAGTWLPGKWVLLGLSWITDSKLGVRGMSRLAQLQRIQKTEGGFVGCLFLDAGPANAPPAAPTLGALTVDGDGVVTIPVTVIPVGVEPTAARVQYAVAPAMPDSLSGEWRSLERIWAPGSVRTPRIEGGQTAWVRARTEGSSMRSSAWTIPVSIAVPVRPTVINVYAVQNADKSVTVFWTPGPDAMGVRIYFGTHNAGQALITDVPATIVDVFAAAGQYTIAADALGTDSMFTAIVQPWTGFVDGSVYGVDGQARQAELAVDLTAAEEEARLTIELEQVERDENHVKWRILWGARIAYAFLWVDRVKDGAQVTEPADGAVDYDDMLLPDEDEFLELDVPISPEVTWISIRPFLASGAKGLGLHFPLYPTDAPADRIVSFGAIVVSEDGSVLLPVIADTRVQSVAIGYNVGPRGAVTEPNVSQVEDPAGVGLSGRIAAAIFGSDTFTLPAGTVDYNQEIDALILGYVRPSQLGPNGLITEHGEEVRATGIREMPSVSLAATTIDDSDPVNGYFGATLKDPGGFALEIVGQSKIGSDDWSAETVLSSSPVDGTEYVLTVPKERGHPSTARVTARGVDATGAPFETHVETGGFDYGLDPNVFALIPHIDEDTGNGTATLLLDPDTIGGGGKILASTSPISDATLLASTLRVPPVGQLHLFPANLGTLVGGMVPGDTMYLAAVGYDRNGAHGEIARVTIQYAVIGAELEPFAASENQGTHLGTFSVKLKDDFGQADAIYYQKRAGGATWPTSWTLETSSPTANTVYTETVAIDPSGHVSQIRFRLDQTIRGRYRPVTIESPAFDWGSASRVALSILLDQVTGSAKAIVSYNFDTARIRVVAAVNSIPSDATLRGTGSTSTPAGSASVQSGVLATALSGGDIVYVKALGEDSAGNESPIVLVQEEFQQITPGTPPVVDNARIVSTDFYLAPEDHGGGVLRCAIKWVVADAPNPAYKLEAEVYVNDANIGFSSNIDPGSSPFNIDLSVGTVPVGDPCYVSLSVERQSDGQYLDTKVTTTQTVQPP